jgi:MYXO-CTERM domain-containing protein
VLASAVLPALLCAAAFGQSTIYSNIPATLAGNYPSQPFQAQQTFEFGDRINFGGADRLLQSATITMSSWALSPDASTSFDHPLTLNIYAAGSGNTPGALLGTVTQVQTILYRPAVWNNPDTGNPYGGIACNVTFDLSGLNLTAPDSIVWGIAYNTQTYGANPIGSDGPWNSLNVACNTAAGGGITAGSNDNLDDVMWNTVTAGWYADGGAGGVGVFRQDTGWTGYTPMISFSAVPTPGAAAVAGLGGLAALRRRRR